MCLPLHFVKLVMRWISVIILSFACFILFVGLLLDNEILSSIFIILRLAILPLGICGCLGQRFKSCICLSLFNVYFICLFILLIIIAVVVLILIYYMTLLNYTTIIRFAESTFCQPDCICYLDPKGPIPLQYMDQNNFTYSTLNTSYPINSQHCQQNNDLEYNYEQNIMQQLEETYDCSGIQDIYPIYLFSNLNRGFPKQNCSEFLNTEITKQFAFTSLWFFLIIGFMGFLLFMSCCLCCNQTNERIRLYPYISYKQCEDI